MLIHEHIDLLPVLVRIIYKGTSVVTIWFKSVGSRHILSLPLAFLLNVSDDTQSSVGSVTFLMTLNSSILSSSAFISCFAAKRSETGFVFVKVFFFFFFFAFSVHCNNACFVPSAFLQCSVNAIAMKLKGTKGNSAIVCILQWRHNDIIRCQVTLNQRLII